MDVLRNDRLSITGRGAKSSHSIDFGMLGRRRFGALALAAAGGILLSRASHATAAETARLVEAITQLELRSGGRLGVCLLDTKTGAQVHHRGEERFPMCSTFKLLASAAVLKSMGGRMEGLDRRIRIAVSDVVEYSPVTREH